jgi:hypothetical protein
LSNNQIAVEAWKNAKYGNNAEAMASGVKKLLGNERRILSEKSFLNLLKLRGYVILD